MAASKETSLVHALILIGYRESVQAPMTPSALTLPNHPSVGDNDSWESELRALGESDPETAITGIVFQYPHHLFAILESNESGLGQAVRLTHRRWNTNDREKSTRFLPIHTIFNMKQHMFPTLLTRGFDPPLRQASPISASPTPSARSRQSPQVMGSTAREMITQMILRLLITIRLHSSPSIKKTLELVGEKSPLLFPEPELIESTFQECLAENSNGVHAKPDTNVWDSGTCFEEAFANVVFGLNPPPALKALNLDDDLIWPLPRRSFGLSITMDIGELN